MKKILFAVVVACSFSTSALAIGVPDLYTVYQQALQSDPTLLQAKATRDANGEAMPQAVSDLLPNAVATGQTESVHSTLLNDSNANQHFYNLLLTQPVFNLQNWMQVRVANNTVKQADATYNAAVQDLIIRVATAYFNVLEAQDTLRFTEAQKTATGDQLKQIKDKYQVGLATMTDVYQAQASYDSLVAQEITAQNQIVNNLEALRQITGVSYNTLAPLVDKIPLVTPQPDNVQQWIGAGEQNNWTLLAARYAAQSAKENIRVNFAGHFPTLNAVGSYQKGNNLGASEFSTQSEESQKVVGLQFNVPIFSGGMVSSQTRQAQDQYLASSEAMEGAHRQVIFQTQESFNNVMAGISKIQADRIAITSASSALDSTDAGYKAGTKTILDVLTAEQNLFQAQANLSADQYAYINNTLSLKEAAGSLNAQDVVAINNWLKNE